MYIAIRNADISHISSAHAMYPHCVCTQQYIYIYIYIYVIKIESMLPIHALQCTHTPCAHSISTHIQVPILNEYIVYQRSVFWLLSASTQCIKKILATLHIHPVYFPYHFRGLFEPKKKSQSNREYIAYAYGCKEKRKRVYACNEYTWCIIERDMKGEFPKCFMSLSLKEA